MQRTNFEAAVAVALDLPEEDRRKLADLIYDSLPEDADEIGCAADVAEWNRRVEAIDSGRAGTFSADEVSANARELLVP
jgi:putative addiction module component (TIGR02574 family)